MPLVSTWADVVRDVNYTMEYLKGPRYECKPFYAPMRERLFFKRRVKGDKSGHNLSVRGFVLEERLYTVFRWLK